MKSHRSLSLLFCIVLALAATAAQAATNEAARPAVTTATPVAVAAPTWDPSILASLPAPTAAKSETPLPFLQPGFCPPSCLGCGPPLHCTAPCHVTFGCTICSCHS